MRNFVLISVVLYAVLLCVGCIKISVHVDKPVSSGEPSESAVIPEETNAYEIPRLPRRPLGSEQSSIPQHAAYLNDPSCPAAKRKLQPNYQKLDSWCWIASAQAIMKAHDISLAQCDIASTVPSENDPKDCCGPDQSDYKCARNGRPEYVFNAYEFPYRVITRPLEPEEISWQLCNNGPFIFLVLYDGGGGHSYVVSDYYLEGSQMFLWVIDHKSQRFQRWSYDQFLTGAVQVGVQHHHDWDYVCIGPECPL